MFNMQQKVPPPISTQRGYNNAAHRAANKAGPQRTMRAAAPFLPAR
jgi:hypothetical protein